MITYLCNSKLECSSDAREAFTGVFGTLQVISRPVAVSESFLPATRPKQALGIGDNEKSAQVKQGLKPFRSSVTYLGKSLTGFLALLNVL